MRISDWSSDVCSSDLVFEVHYLGKVVDDLQYDMIYHEHLYYYSVLSAMKHFERYGMTIFDIKPIPIHAGSIRCYVCKNGSRQDRKSVVSGKSVSVRVDLGGRRIIKKKKKK